MIFKTILMKDVLRFVKEKGIYESFKKALRREMIINDIKTEKGLFECYDGYISMLPYILRITDYLNLNEDDYNNLFYIYLYENNKNNFIQFFENFLEKNNIKEMFFQNANFEFIEKTGRLQKALKTLKLYDNKKDLVYNNLPPKAFFMNSFEWATAKQKNNFWNNINEKWVKELENYISKGHYKYNT